MTQTSAPAQSYPVPVRPADAYAPARLSHLALITKDAEAATDFYTKVMRMELVTAVMHERLPSTGDIMPYLHIFFRMQDGSTIAFFEVAGLPELAPVPHPGYDLFNHIALEVPDTQTVDEWKTWLEGKGIEVLGPVDHTIIYSIYFYDPDGNRLEITTPLVSDWNDRPTQARQFVDAWVAAKRQAAAEGREAVDVLRELVAASDPTQIG